jgi:mannose-6-phosphate isomerase-like protein (cupin superfamily)
MRISAFSIAASVVLLFGCASAPPAPTPKPTAETKAIPLILEKNEGEQRTWRVFPGEPKPFGTFILKVDPQSGASEHLVFGTETLGPGEPIETHKHLNADEILFLETGTTRVHLGDEVRVVHGGSTVFIPAGTWVSLSNIGRDPLKLAFVFSSPGFERFMRAESVRPGEKYTPISKAEDVEIQKRLNVVIYK